MHDSSLHALSSRLWLPRNINLFQPSGLKMVLTLLSLFRKKGIQLSFLFFMHSVPSPHWAGLTPFSLLIFWILIQKQTAGKVSCFPGDNKCVCDSGRYNPNCRPSLYSQPGHLCISVKGFIIIIFNCTAVTSIHPIRDKTDQ